MPNEHERAEQYTNGMAIASLVTGIISVCLIPFLFFGLPELSSILTIIFGAVGIRQTKRLGIKGHGMAVSGLVLGIIVLILSIAFVIFGSIAMMNWYG